jgi:putative peptidoglycan lipid II flippase
MNKPMSTDGPLARSAGVIGSLTFMSRILGFIRDILIAYAFGTTRAAEAFVVSFKLPNLFRDLVGEGAMNAAIVPVLTETRTLKGEEAFRRLATALFFWLGSFLFALAIAGVVFAPIVVRLVAPGFVNDPEKFDLTVRLTRLIFPFIFLVGLSAYLMGLLNTMKNFATSALSSSLLNITMIAALCFVVPVWGVQGLALGILLGGLIQCAPQIISLFRVGFKFMRSPLLHDGVIKIMHLMGPRLWGTAVYQISVFVDTILASFVWVVGDGGQSALYYSSRIFQLPLAVFGVSIATAMLPTLSGHHAEQNKASFKGSLEFSLKNVIYASMPAAVGLAILSESIITVLFKRGEFSAYSVDVTSGALFFYSLGLVSCAVIKVLVSAFYALQDTKTPVKTATLCLFMNVGLNLMFMGPLKIGGLALATSIAATVNAVMLFVLIKKRLEWTDLKSIRTTLLQSLFGSLVMVLCCVFVLIPWLDQAIAKGSKSGILVLLLTILLGASAYFLTTLLIGSDEARQAKRFFIKA